MIKPARLNIFCVLILTIGLIVSLFSTLTLAQKVPNQLKSGKDYIDIVKYYRYLNPDSALLFVKQGISFTEKYKDLNNKAALLNQYGMIEDNFARYGESRQKYLEALLIYKNQKDSVGLAATLIRLGVVERRKGNYNKSFAYTMESMKLSEESNNKMGILEARIVLSENYYDLSDYQSALKYLKEAEEIEKQIPFSNLSLNMYDDLGSTYIKLKDDVQAIKYINIGLAKSNNIAYNGLKISLLKTLGRAYKLRGDQKKAEQKFKEALLFSRKIKNVLREHAILIELADFYEKKAPDTALSYLTQALDILIKLKMYRQEILVLNKISTIYKQKGEFDKALTAKESANEIAEKVFYKDMMNQVFSLEAAYELEKSKSQLKELTLKSNKQAMVKNTLLSVSVSIFLVLVVMLIYYFRSKKLNAKLKIVNKSLEESNYTKDKFFSIIAHDIRSPIVSTIGLLRLISSRDIDDETRDEMVEKLAQHSQNSLEVLDKLLKWGQMQIKGIRLNPVEFHPAANINASVALLKQAVDQKQIALTIDVAENLLLKADPDHFDFVIRNLMANAIKFTPAKGHINLTAREVKNGLIRFELADSGVGISAARINTIFELSSIGTKGTSQEEGTSLGLIICKEFILANHGSIEVQSKPGKGTEFIFSFKGYQDQAK